MLNGGRKPKCSILHIVLTTLNEVHIPKYHVAHQVETLNLNTNFNSARIVCSFVSFDVMKKHHDCSPGLMSLYVVVDQNADLYS